MFGSKARRIKELENKIAMLKNKLRFAEVDNTLLRDKIDDMEALSDETPADCVRGSWCESCSFAKIYYIHDGEAGRYNSRKVYFCGKGRSCSSFVQKEA